MCGYCTERIDIFTLWQHGRFAPPAEAEPNSAYSLSLECPSFNQLLAMQQNQQPLAADIVLIRLACYALTQPLDSAAQQLCQAMRNQLTAEQNLAPKPSPWPWLDNALQHIYLHGCLPYADINALPAEFHQQVKQALLWTAEHIYPAAADSDSDDDAAWDEQQHQQMLTESRTLAKTLYSQFRQILLATLLMQQLQPQHPALQQIALKANVSFTLMPALELALRRQLQYHCVCHYGKDWLWQHLHQLELQHIFYLAARCRLEPGEITALQIKLEDEFTGLDYFMSRKDCIDALTMLSLAVEFGFEEIGDTESSL